LSIACNEIKRILSARCTSLDLFVLEVYLLGTHAVWISDSSIYPAFNGSTLSCHISLKLLYTVQGHHDNSNYRCGLPVQMYSESDEREEGKKRWYEFNNKHLYLRRQKPMKRLSTVICFQTNCVQRLRSFVQSWLILRPCDILWRTKHVRIFRLRFIIWQAEKLTDIKSNILIIGWNVFYGFVSTDDIGESKHVRSRVYFIKTFVLLWL
jgi:hypothetical protein